MESRGGDHLRKLLHVRRFDINNVETLLRDLHVPEIHSQIISRNVRLTVATQRNGVDMVGVSVGEDLLGRSHCHRLGVGDGRKCKSACCTGWGHLLNVFLRHLPQLNGLV